MNYHIRSGSWLAKVAYFTARHLGYPKVILITEFGESLLFRKTLSPKENP